MSETRPQEGMKMSMRHIVKYPDCNATDNLFGGQMKTRRLVTRLFGAVESRSLADRCVPCTRAPPRRVEPP